MVPLRPALLHAGSAGSRKCAFGESFLYYSAVNPSTRRLERKVTFVKRVVVYGLPLLIGSGYYHPDEGP